MRNRFSAGHAIPTWVTGVITAFVAGYLYTRTLQPTLGGTFNSEEYQYAAYSLSLVHPTGYPLFLLLGKLWVTLVPLRDVAFRMNLFSAWWATAAAVLTFLIIYQITHSNGPSLLGALLFATNEAVWRYASVAEVDTFTAFLFGLLFLSLILWRGRKLPLELCGLAYGLALVHHRTSLLYSPGILVFILLSRPQEIRSPARVLRTLLLLFLPLLFYLYVPLRSATSPGYSFDLGSLLQYALGLGAGSGNPVSPDKWLAGFDVIYHSYFWDWFTPFGIGLAALGAWSPRKGQGHGSADDNSNSAAIRISLLAIFASVTLFTIPYELADIDRYLLVPVMTLAILAGTGAAQLCNLMRDLFRRFAPSSVKAWRVGFPRFGFIEPTSILVLLVLFLLPVRAGLVNLPQVDMSGNDKEYRFWDEVFGLPLEPGAVVIGNWSELNAMLYMQRVEGRRTDLVAVGASANPKELTRRVQANLSPDNPLYLTPGVPNPTEDYHYNALGPLLRLSDLPVLTGSAPPARLVHKLGPLTLTGYGLTPSLEGGAEGTNLQVGSNQNARLYLYWRVDAPVTADYQVRLRFLDSQNHNLWQWIEPPLRGVYPTSQWQKGEYVTDVHGVSIPAGTPPGLYSIQLDLMDGRTQPVADSVTLPDVIGILAPSLPSGHIFVRQKTSVHFGPLDLLGYEAPSAPLRPGGRLTFYVVWRTEKDLHENYSVLFRIIDAGGRAWDQPLAPLVREYPTSAWRDGDAFKEYWTIEIPGSIAPGSAKIDLALVDAGGHKVNPLPGPGDEFALFSFLINP